MSLELTPLDEEQLAPPIRKALTPNLRPLLAKGMAPLPPVDLVVALYQLKFDEDEALREVGHKTAWALPDAVLGSALAANLDKRVLDWLARMVVARPKMLQAVLMNTAVADETFAHLASVCAEQQLETIAQNEQRLLRHPAIISALYLNRKTRMSTATRALELAVRNNVEVEGIPSFEDVKAAILHEGTADDAADEAFNRALHATSATTAAPDDEQAIKAEVEAADQEAARDAQGEEKSEKAVAISQLSTAAKVRLATLGNAFARAILIRDTNRVIALAAVRSPAVTEQEAEAFAANRGLNDDVIRYLAGQRQFTRRYSVKLNLVNNPKCPLQASMVFLGHLTAKDLKIVARSKGVPSALAKAAQSLEAKRGAR